MSVQAGQRAESQPRPGCMAQTHLLRKDLTWRPEGAVVLALGQDHLQMPEVW